MLFRCLGILVASISYFSVVLADSAKPEIYYFSDSFVGTTFKRDANGKKVSTHERIFFKKGDVIKVTEDAKTGLLYTFINADSQTKELVILPKKNVKRGIAANGEQFVITTDLLKKARKGSAGTVARLLGEKGTDDAVFYFNGAPHERVPLTSEPTFDDFVCDDKQIDNSICVARPSSEDQLRVLDAKVVYSKSPVTGEFSPRLYYFVQTHYCRQGTSEDCKNKRLEKELRGGWIAADRLTEQKQQAPSKENISSGQKFSQRVQRDDPFASRKCDTPEFKKTFNGVSDLLNSEEGDSGQKIYDSLGSCFDKKYVEGVKKIEAELIADCKAKNHGVWNHDFSDEKEKRLKDFAQRYFKDGVNSHPFQNIIEKNWQQRISSETAKNGSTKPTQEQLYAIDAMARTLYGEMRGCSNQTSAFYKAIGRVILNRAAVVKNQGSRKPFYNSSQDTVKGQSLPKLIPKVVSWPEQFSAWNIDDVNLKTVLCPKDNPSALSQKAWKEATQVATQAVLDTETFLKDTEGIHQTHYSSGKTPSWTEVTQKDKNGKDVKVQVKTKQEAFRVGDESYSEPECLTLWNDDLNKTIESLSKDTNNYAFQLKSLGPIGKRPASRLTLFQWVHL
ncbi:MAG: hypothetical protein ACXVCY_07835 [Pseudobdellovibrionaceae bacterium]